MWFERAIQYKYFEIVINLIVTITDVEISSRLRRERERRSSREAFLLRRTLRERERRPSRVLLLLREHSDTSLFLLCV